MEKKKWDLLALASIPLIMTFGGSMLIPVLPTIQKKLGITGLQSSLIITIYSIISIILIPFAGYLSDKYGRKKIIIPSLIITAIGGAVSGWAAYKTSYSLIILGRTIQGVGASGAFPVVIPTVGDMYKKEEEVSKGLGIIETSNTFGKVLSPIIGSILAAWLWFSPLFSISVFAIASIILVSFLVKVPKQNQEASNTSVKEYFINIKGQLKINSKWVFGVFAAGFICTLVLFGLLYYLSTILEKKYGIEGIKKGLVLAVPLLTLCSVSYIIGRVLGKKKKLMKWIVLVGGLIASGALLFITLPKNYIIIVTIASTGGIGIGAALPCLDALVTEGIEKKYRGTITCIYSSMRLLGVALGPPLLAILIKNSQSLIAYTFAALSICASAAAFFLIKPDPDAMPQ